MDIGMSLTVWGLLWDGQLIHIHLAYSVTNAFLDRLYFYSLGV